MICPFCGNEHLDSAKFCPVTGKTIDALSQVCPNCGHNVDPSLSFCPSCGEILSNSSETVPPVPQPSFQETSVAEATDSREKSHLRYLFIGLLIIGIALIIGGAYILIKPQDDIVQTNSVTSVSELPSSNPNSDGELTELPEQDIVNVVQPTEAQLIPTPTMKAIPTSTPNNVPSPTASIEPTAAFTVQPENLPIAVEINPIDGAEYVLIPAGEFLMGSDPDKDPYFWGAEGPEHTVYLDEYWIYRTEVTNGMYQVCVEQQKCPRPQYQNSVEVEDYYGNPEYANFPVINVTFTHAQGFCNWAGGKLPSEAQWEKAARGTEGIMFPWGDALPNPELVNLCDNSCARGSERENHFSDGYPGTSPVGSFPDGASPYGVLDMAGNVWEWTIDWFQSTYYNTSPEDNPLGPATGITRTIRGGSWFNPTSGVRAAARTSLTPQKVLDTLGFRCVMELP